MCSIRAWVDTILLHFIAQIESIMQQLTPLTFSTEETI